jgi:methionyl aminopeptidase
VRGSGAQRTAEQVALIRGAGAVVYEVLEELSALCKPGVTTFELARVAERRTRKHKAIPIFKGYGAPESPFPEVICISVNEEVVHGIPSADRRLAEGDLVSLDYGVVLEGWYADSAVTVPVGAVDEASARLVEVTRQALARAVAEARPGQRVGDLGAAAQAWTESQGYQVVRDFVGHGVGRRLHEPPQIPNFGTSGTGPRLKAGMVLAIEPMVNAGVASVDLLEDGWTAVTQDGRRSAHFEHTVAITDNGPDILTLPRGSTLTLSEAAS